MPKFPKRSLEADLSDKTVLAAFKKALKPLSRGELLRLLGARKRLKGDLDAVLETLLEQGAIIRLQGGMFGSAEGLKLVTGRLEIQRSGVGFVIPDDKRRKDVFIKPPNLGEARHGDLVAVALAPAKRGKKPEGRIARIVKRAKESLVCVIVRIQGGTVLCTPVDFRQRVRLLVETEAMKRAGFPVKVGDAFEIGLGERLEADLWSGTPEAFLGAETEALVQEALVKRGHDIPTRFPADVLDEASRFPTVPAEADATEPGRVDLRGEMFVTIDGAKARDFDDAVVVKKTRTGFNLKVAVADVAHYVQPGTALDREARNRGNSYYFPQSVEPMFPEGLSNGLCSLNPHVSRLVMVADMDFTKSGDPGPARFYSAVIESKQRLTYGGVNKALFLGDEAERERIKPVLPMLEEAERLARLLKERRSARGSLDFDLPEPEILFNLDGEPVDVRPKVRHFGHQIIEECMLAANEAVARFLTERGAGLLYRVHPPADPDKVGALFGLVRKTELGQSLPKPAKGTRPGPEALKGILAAAAGTELEYLVNRLALRSMMQARYSPVNEGHFGLASACYCHFTSPIRRYADLVVHRALKAAFGGPAHKTGVKALGALGDELSQLERKGMEAEREIVKRMSLLALMDRVGESFTGVVSGVSDYGFWVELTEIMAEGMVRLSSIPDDFHRFDPERMELIGERTGRRFFLGKKVEVELADLTLSRLEVSLVLTGRDQSKRSGRAGAPHSGGGRPSGGRRSRRR